jgi:hypothetical protein
MGSPRAISTSGLVLAMLVLAAGPARAGDGEEPLGTPPANDNFANAQPLSGSTARASGTNEDATSEPGEPDHADGEGHSVWYRWTAPASGRVIVDTCDSDFDTTMAVYTGGAVNALTRVAANDDGCNDEQSRVTFNATRGTTYWIAIDTFIDEGGDIVLALGPVPKPRPGRYSGLTEPPAPRRVKFLLSSTGRSVRNLRVSFDLQCRFRGFPVGTLRGRNIGGFAPLPVRANGTFSTTRRVRGGGARMIITVAGRLRPPSRATGTLRPRVFIPGGVTCRHVLGTAEWTALHR